MERLSEQFTREALRNLEQAAALGIRSPRLEQQLREHGADAAAYCFRRGRATELFLPLKNAGQLKLSLEALAVQGKYGALFTDEEMDVCLSLLMDAGYF